MDEKMKEFELQIYCCGECGKQFAYREVRCYSRYCPECGNFMAHIDDTEQVAEEDKSALVVGGYF